MAYVNSFDKSLDRIDMMKLLIFLMVFILIAFAFIFLMIIPNVKEDICGKIAERIRADIEEIEMFYDIKITASIGVYTPKKNESVDNILYKADKAMYFSKKNGKNRVTLYSSLKNK